MKLQKLISGIRTSVLAAAAAVIIAPALPAAAAPSPKIREAQTILTKFGIPAGPVDGYYGPQTARGLCAFRYMAGETPGRGRPSAALLAKIRSYGQSYPALSNIPARTEGGQSTYVVVEKKCQILVYVENGRYIRIMPASTGIAGFNTPNGTYRLGGTQRGWSCSTLYPESCLAQSSGRFSRAESYGNMYNKRAFATNGYYIHGSTDVPTRPASHGCIRISVGDSDWMYDRVGNKGRPVLFVMNEY